MLLTSRISENGVRCNSRRDEFPSLPTRNASVTHIALHYGIISQISRKINTFSEKLHLFPSELCFVQPSFHRFLKIPQNPLYSRDIALCKAEPFRFYTAYGAKRSQQNEPRQGFLPDAAPNISLSSDPFPSFGAEKNEYGENFKPSEHHCQSQDYL